jgi:hypothetical protein
MCVQATVDLLDVQSQDQQIIESGIQTAEQLLHSLLVGKRRLTLDDGTRDCTRSCPPPTKKRRTPKEKKSVRFSEEKRVHSIDVTTEDGFLCHRWYQQDDYTRIKQENRDTLAAISRANGKITTIDATEFCVRGLELQISVLLLQMPFNNRQKKVVRSVLRLQQVQRKMQTQDTQAIREMSRIISMQDKLKAWKIASIDAYNR